MKNALRIMLALVVATMFIGGGLAGTVAAQDEQENEAEQEIEQSISDDDLVDAQVNALNPTTATAVNAVNIGSGGQTAVADADAYNNAGDSFEQEAEQEAELENED